MASIAMLTFGTIFLSRAAMSLYGALTGPRDPEEFGVLVGLAYLALLAVRTVAGIAFIAAGLMLRRTN
jgi:hypothetical protein